MKVRVTLEFNAEQRRWAAMSIGKSDTKKMSAEELRTAVRLAVKDALELEAEHEAEIEAANA